MPEFIDPVFTKTSPKRSFSLNRKRAFWLVFAKTGSIISDTGLEVILCLFDTMIRRRKSASLYQIRLFPGPVNFPYLRLQLYKPIDYIYVEFFNFNSSTILSIS